MDDFFKCCTKREKINYECDICYGKCEKDFEVKSCGHVYHKKCIDEWLKFNLILCPSCFIKKV